MMNSHPPYVRPFVVAALVAALSVVGLQAQETATTAAAPPPPVGPPAPGPFSGWTLSGFLETSYTYNTNFPDSRTNNLRCFDTRHNSFDINSLSLRAYKAATEATPVGFEGAIMAGQDSTVIHATGLNVGDNVDVVQANIQIRIPGTIPGLSGGIVKIGKFITTAGSEVINGPENANFSRSLLFRWAIPFTHTGVMFSNGIDVGNEIALNYYLGVVNGWDNVSDNNEGKTVMLGASVKPCEQFNVGINTFIGPENPTGAGQNNDKNRGLIDIVATFNLPSGFSLGANFDYGAEESSHSVNGNYGKWYGLALYARNDFAALNLCECLNQWYAAVRGEVLWDPDGARIDANALALGLGPALDVRSSSGNIADRYGEITVTLGWKPYSDLLVRFEYRWDKSDEKIFEYDHRDDARSFQSTLATNVVFTF